MTGPSAFDAWAGRWRPTALLPPFVTGRIVASELGSGKAPCMKTSAGSNGSVTIGVNKLRSRGKVFDRRTMLWMF